MTYTNKATRAIIAIILLLIMSVSGGAYVRTPAHATTEKYSDVMSDLKRDEAFDVWDYPHNPLDFSLQVIQIAESTDGELFVYVYQPSAMTADLRATSVKMSLSESVTSTRLYNLEYVNRSGVFAKYVVKELTVSSSEIRYYNNNIDLSQVG